MKKQQAQAQAHYCFKQEAGSNIVKLYIYDDVSEYGEFDWWTWEYKESETSAKYFKKALENVSESDTIELHINSYGGSVKEGVAIYNLLKQKNAKRSSHMLTGSHIRSLLLFCRQQTDESWDWEQAF